MYVFISSLLSELLNLNYLFLIIIVFFERKDPIKVLSWVLLLLFIPILGFFAYIFFNARIIYTRKKHSDVIKSIDKHTSYEIKKQMELLENDRLNLPKELLNTCKSLIHMNSIYANSLFTSDNDIYVFTNGSEKFDKLFEDIKNAKESINILYFIIRNDSLGRELIRLLCEKAKEGITVNLMYDFIGNIMTRSKLFNDLKKSGGNVKPFLPNLLLWNYRNHRKIVVIDDIIGYTGGMNVGIEYIGKHKKIKPWRDTHLRIYGNGVTELKKIFYIDWYYSSKEKLNNFHNTVFTNYDDSSSCNFGTNRLQLVSSGPDMNEEQVKYGYIKIITLAKKSIYIQTPYFAPDSEFLSALKVAHFSGVKVILTIPRVADKMYVYLATLSYIEELVSIGIEVHLYDGFIHSKMIIVDDCITSIGSTNIDVRSFSLSFETNAFIYDNILGSKCSKIFLYDLKNSVKLTDEHMKNKNPIMRTFQSICKLISPLF